MKALREIEVIRRNAQWTARVKGLSGDRTPTTRLGNSRRIVVLVHGYNNDPEEAGKGYRELRGSLEKLGIRPDINDSIWDLYWPSYIPKGSWGWWREYVGQNISRASYPLQLAKAEQIGIELARYFERTKASTGSLVQLVFVAHSLGCRLVLEILKNLGANTNRVSGICLMAAAVPTSEVELHGTLRDAALKPGKRYILYSPADTVLERAFPLGQAAGTLNSFPEAVGRFGNPRTLWDTGYETSVNTWLNHGDYFRGRRELSIAPSSTAPYVARLLGRPTPWELRSHKADLLVWKLPKRQQPRSNKPGSYKSSL